MCKQLDEPLIGQCEHNITQGFLLVLLLCYQKDVNKSPILSLSLYLGLLNLNPSIVHVILNWYWAQLDKRYEEGKSNW